MKTPSWCAARAGASARPDRSLRPGAAAMAVAGRSVGPTRAPAMRERRLRIAARGPSFAAPVVSAGPARRLDRGDSGALGRVMARRRNRGPRGRWHGAQRAPRQLLDIPQIGPLFVAAEGDRDP